jgi:hypothetical protein
MSASRYDRYKAAARIQDVLALGGKKADLQVLSICQ